MWFTSVVNRCLTMLSIAVTSTLMCFLCGGAVPELPFTLSVKYNERAASVRWLQLNSFGIIASSTLVYLALPLAFILPVFPHVAILTSFKQLHTA
jgi:hypothetical protein